MPETNEITSDQISALRTEAGQAGDLEMVAICDQALAGDEAARSECADVIAAAQAMDDSPAETWWEISRWNETPLYGWGTEDEAIDMVVLLQAADPDGRGVGYEPADLTVVNPESGEGFNLADELAARG